ncbi:cysteine desulfurase [Candidatus Woesearchaeota archaeon]|nr:cysteine desulfurase [Candidatus Woesearchaeota archaeon]
MANVEKLRKDFPILNSKNAPIYFDNACNTLRPRQVLDVMNEYYEDFPSCVGRSHHKLSQLATQKVDAARKQLQNFVGAKKSSEIIFTRNATEGFNLIANSLDFEKNDIIVNSDKEHNSNLVPWLVIEQKKGLKRVMTTSNTDNTFDVEAFEQMMNKGVKLVSIVETSNMDGVTNPIKKIAKIAHDYGALVLVDGAQSTPHFETNVKNSGVDFMAFSAHKMLGPSGMGALYINQKHEDSLAPFIVGGDTVSDTTYEQAIFEKPPKKFEAGLQNYAGIIGFGAAANYLKKRVGFSTIKKQDLAINNLITDKLLEHNATIIGPKDAKERSGIVSFYLQGLDNHQLAMMLDKSANIAVRSGVHCVHSWFNAHKLDGSVRVSSYFYNTIKEAQKFNDALDKVLKVMIK